MACNSIDEEDEDELGAFIYNSSRTAKRLRANKEKSSSSSSSSSQPRMSPRLPNAPDIYTPRVGLHGKKRSLENNFNDDRASRKPVPVCCAIECANQVNNGGDCVRHGAKVEKREICRQEGCTDNVQNRGIYTRHGANEKTCSHEGCVVQGGACIRHGAKAKTLSDDGCTNINYRNFEAESLGTGPMHPSLFMTNTITTLPFTLNVPTGGNSKSSHPIINKPGDKIRTSEFVKDSFLSDTMASAAAPLQAVLPSAARNDGKKPSSSQQKKQIDEYYSSENPTAKLKRICTDDSITSREWTKGFAAESLGMGHMQPSLCMANPSTTLPFPLNVPADPYEECKLPLARSQHHAQPLPLSNTVASILPAETAAANKTDTSLASSTVSQKRKRKKKRKTRVLDESRVVQPTDDDILFGRGNFTNTHPGNNYFRRQASELLPLYKQSSKEEKHKVTNFLIEFVKFEGHRFLEKGEDGLWHEVVDGEFSKASQTFRDLYKRPR